MVISLSLIVHIFASNKIIRHAHRLFVVGIKLKLEKILLLFCKKKKSKKKEEKSMGKYSQLSLI